MRDKLNVEIPDTGATTLASLAFTDGGARLWISAGGKKAAVGVTIYRVL